VEDESLLVSQRAAAGAFGNGVGHPARQRTNPGMREENFAARDGKFAPAKFFIGQNFRQ